jgi:hypothetical protein
MKRVIFDSSYDEDLLKQSLQRFGVTAGLGSVAPQA